MPLFGPPNIEKMTEKRDVKGLVKVLKEQADPQLRGQAVQALLQLRDPQSADPLYEARNDSNCGVQALAAIALAYLGDSRAVECLTGTLDTGGELSIKLLGMLGGSQAVRPLIRIIENSYHAKSDANIIAAAEALGNLGDTRAIQPLIHAQAVCNDPARPAILKALTAFGASAVGPLIEKLTEGWNISKDRWDSIRDKLEAAFLALGAPARDGLVESLDQSANFELLKDKVTLLKKMDGGLDSAQAKAADALVRGDKEQIANLGPEAERLLFKLWGSLGGGPELATLVRIWGAGAADRLIEYLEDKEQQYANGRAGAIKALGDLGDEKAVPCLAALLHGHFGENKAALEAIRKFHTPEAIRAVEGLLDFSQSSDIRSAAIEVLEGWNWTPPRGKAGAVYYITRGEWGKFEELGEPVTAQITGEILNFVLNTETIELLGHIRDPRVETLLIRALENGDSLQRIAACDALAETGGPGALEALEKVAQFDSHFNSSGGGSEPSNPWAYDHTGGGSDYWSEKEEPVVYVYPVRNAARAAIEAIKQKA